MLRYCFSLFGLLLVSFCALAQAPYYPDAVWQRKTPAEAGVNAQRLKDAVDYGCWRPWAERSPRCESYQQILCIACEYSERIWLGCGAERGLRSG